MRTGLTKQEKTTDIWFDEKDPLIHIRTHNTDLKKRLAAYTRQHPDQCRQTDADPETGCMEFEIAKGRFSFRLTAPYNEERREAAADELENAGEVFAIYILSQYYGKGIGYRLMQTALSELADHSKIAVWVLKENTKAIRFYERCGYRFDGREQIIELGSPVVAARMVLER